MAKKEVTKAPTGLSIVRSENSFTASWKIGDKDYGDGQYFQYAIDTTGKVSWLPTKNTGIGTTTTSKVITTINKSNYYPNTDSGGNNKPFLYNIYFRVAGNRKKYTTRSRRKKKTHNPSSSAWTSKGFVVNPPKKPTLTYVLDEELTNVCTFSWNAPYESNDSYIFTDVQWQTILVKNSSETNGSKLDWSKAEEGTGGAEGSKTITEDTSILYKNGNSYTRWFRARSRGPRGVYTADGSNGWVYEKHVYALSHQADVTGTSASETEEGGFQCTVDWTAGQSGGQNPIDKTIAQYTITTPDRGLTCPSGASWKDANISRDTEAGDAAVFGIDDQLGKDQCLFIRVNTQHDSNITYGKPQLSYVGFLKDPSGLSVSTDNATHKATITATNNSAVEDSILIVRYVPSSGDPIDVGVIPHGSTSVTVQCPNWDDQKAVAFDVYAIVGTAVKQTRADGVDSYSVSVGMRSQNTVSQGGAVPVAPKNVSVSRVEGKSDTVRVDWDWPWSEAGSAEISWSDHDDAWESTDGPESFLISNLHASHWNISGLETGKTWYVRVRLIAGNMATSDGVTYGPWSDVSQGTIDLSSAPNKPVLILSNSVIPEDGSTIASWVYTTTDNTAQAYAEVAIVENGAYIPIAHSLTAQHVTIPAQSENYTLSTGNIYNLVCRVKSASGKLSEWSDIVSLTVAEPITCEIVQTSLVHDHIELNPREFGPGDLLTFGTELEEDFAKAQVNLEPIQDLNGYSYPWVGGAGKNKLDTSNMSTVEQSGVTFSRASDGTITVGGKADAAVYRTIGSIQTENGVTYTLTGTPSGGTNSTYRITVIGYGYDYGNGYTFTGDGNPHAVAIDIYTGYPSSGTLTFKPMIRLASETDATYAPYENICPINGQDEASVSVVGKNFLEVKKGASGTVGGITATINEDGSIIINGTSTKGVLVIGNLATGFFTAGTAQNDGKKHIPNGQYIMTTGLTTNIGVALQLDGTNQPSGVGDIHPIIEVQVGGTFTIDDTYAYNYVRLFVDAGTYDNVTIRPMIRLASETDSTYEPYNAQTITQDFNATLTPTSTDTTPYLFKAVGDVYGDRLEDKIVGGTVAWNQAVGGGVTTNSVTDTATSLRLSLRNMVSPYNVYVYESNLSTGVYRTLFSATEGSTGTTLIHNGSTVNFNFWANSKYNIISGHKYLFSANIKGVDVTTVGGVIIEDVMLFDLTQMFGSTIADYIYSLEQATAGAGVAWFKKLFPNDYYAYNAGELLSVGGLSAHVMRDADNSVIGNYPLDSSLTLRGIPKLDASNNLYYDGDEYTSDGKVKRKYGIVDLGTLTWTYVSAGTRFSAELPKIKTVADNNTKANIVCPLYVTGTPNDTWNSKDKVISANINSHVILVRDTAYTDAATFKSAMSGVMLVYELATPTTETAQAYTNPQIVSKYGTLEYVTNSIVPVGHKTTYLTRDIFGGYVDLVSGKLVVTHGYEMDLSRLSWGKGNTASGHWRFSTSSLPNVKMGTPTASVADALCSEYDTISANQTWTGVKGFAINDTGNFMFICDESYADVASLKTALKNVSLCYPLATPQTYQLTPQQVNTLVGTNNVWSDSGQVEVRIAESMRDVDTLTKMPLSVKVTGAGDGGIITVIVERAEDYLMVRPDETNFNGNKGEMVLQTSPPLVGINQVSFNTDDLIGPMDDGAVYNIVATVQDGLGQKDSVTLPFEVHWEHQAEEPSAEVVIDEENLIAYIKPIAPANADPEDVADIYRLSADKPELIVEGAIFGETYVDPYPALGDMGGHRIVTRTKNGDYITEGNQIAMIDSPELGVNPIENEDLLNVIDFEGRQIRFYWETDYSNTWAKDFQETAYLGGSIEGDWNPAVSRSGTLSSKAITVLDQEMLKDVRRLANYPGICHVRTADGSSYAADVQVSEDYTDDEKGMVANYSLSITKVGSQGFDGMTKEQWDDENPPEGEGEI